MKFENVCIESLGITLPSEVWTSADVEEKLAPLYQRLKLPEGRLALMTGIEERRFWPADVRPGDVSVRSGQAAIEASGIAPDKIGLLVHGSVCRDFLEPATACGVHHRLGLAADCLVYDVSNACLGILSGMIQAACMIECGQIEAALIVGSEGGRQLVEGTIEHLNDDMSLTRKSIKNAIASLTIGSASAAVLLTSAGLSSTGNAFKTATTIANTTYHDLCQSDQDQAGSGMQPLMQTDSELLLHQGVQTGVTTFSKFLTEAEIERSMIDRTVCHQVGVAHRKLMLESLGLETALDFATFSWLGNTGSAALPSAFAVACLEDFIAGGQKVAWLGIGSGINSTMLEIDWEESKVQKVIWDGR